MSSVECSRWRESGFGWVDAQKSTRDAGVRGESSWAFTGGTIKKVIVDVSGESHLNLEKEVWRSSD